MLGQFALGSIVVGELADCGCSHSGCWCR